MGVLVVEGAAGTAGASLYLERALEISEEGRFRVRVARQDLVRAADLDGVDVVVLNDTRLDGASAERLRDFVRAGGGVAVLASVVLHDAFVSVARPEEMTPERWLCSCRVLACR